jgi:hypothetical protein
MVCAECTTGMEITLGTPNGTPKWKHVLVYLSTVLVLAQDRCTVCAECTIGLETILDAPEVLLGDVGQVEARFSPFGDSVNLGAR